MVAATTAATGYPQAVVVELLRNDANRVDRTAVRRIVALSRKAMIRIAPFNTPVVVGDADAELRLAEIIDGQLSLFGGFSVEATRDSPRLAVEWLCNAYQHRIAGGLDALPYTRGFDRLFSGFAIEHGRVLPFLEEQLGAESRKSALWLTLLGLRKSGRLGNGIRRLDAPSIDISQREIEVARTKISLPASRPERERLPFTSHFRELFRRFHRECRKTTSSTLDHHGFWRVIVRIMKAERVRGTGANLWTDD